MNRLDSCIQNAQGGSDINAYFALTTFSVYKTLNIYQEEFQERLEEIKSDESFKKATIHKLKW